MVVEWIKIVKEATGSVVGSFGFSGFRPIYFRQFGMMFGHAGIKGRF